MQQQQGPPNPQGYSAQSSPYQAPETPSQQANQTQYHSIPARASGYTSGPMQPLQSYSPVPNANYQQAPIQNGYSAGPTSPVQYSRPNLNGPSANGVNYPVAGNAGRIEWPRPMTPTPSQYNHVPQSASHSSSNLISQHSTPNQAFISYPPSSTQERPPYQGPTPPNATSLPRQPPLVGYSQAAPIPTGTPPMRLPGYPVSPSANPPVIGASQQQQPPSSAKINPAAMPSVVSVHEMDQARYHNEGDYFRASLVNDMLPPLTTTDVPIVDDGNCSSRLMRITTYHIPISDDVAHTSRLPVSLVIQPFARQHFQEPPIPLVDFGEKGPIRCTRCRAYINLFVTFVRSGRSFECNICSMINDVPDEYFCQLDHTGKRTDVDQRPELMFGTVDFLASKEYMLRTPLAPYLLFAIDSSRAAIQNGSFLCALDAIRQIVDVHRKGSKTYEKMAIITYDRSIQVYDLRASEPQILVMSDINEPFVPLSDGLFFDPIAAYEQFLALLEKLPSFVMETRIVDSCLGAAASFSIEALRRHGGRAILFCTTLPSIGIGQLRNRDSTGTTPADKVNPLHLQQGEFYSKIGKEAAALGISFGLVSTPAAYIDMATIGKLVTMTSGKVLHYPRFNSDFSGRTLIEDLKMFLTKPFVFDTILRVRAGSNLQTGEYFGNCSTLNQIDHQFAALDCDQSFAVTFFYDGKLNENERVSFQCAVLHTTIEGQRRIRILNLAVPVASQLSDIFRMADLDALIQFSIKRAISQLSSSSLISLMQHFHIRSAQMLASYRKNCASNMPSGQLVLPESLKLLPIYCLALSKSVPFSSGLTPVDTRMAEMYDLSGMSMSLINIYLYPRLYPLHRILELPESDEPGAIRLSQEFLEQHGVYLLANGAKLLLWLGSMADPEILSKLFGVAQLVSISRNDVVPEIQNPLSTRIRSFIEALKYSYSNYMPLQIIRQGIDPTEVEWYSMLVEDTHSTLGLSYVDFLCRLHNQINHEMSSSSLAEKTALLNFLQ